MIAIASDHGGYSLKLEIIQHLKDRGIQVDDLGCSGERVDYPDYAEKLCRAVVAGQYERGILLCGTASVSPLPPIRYTASGRPCAPTATALR